MRPVPYASLIDGGDFDEDTYAYLLATEPTDGYKLVFYTKAIAVGQNFPTCGAPGPYKVKSRHQIPVGEVHTITVADNGSGGYNLSGVKETGPVLQDGDELTPVCFGIGDCHGTAKVCPDPLISDCDGGMLVCIDPIN